VRVRALTLAQIDFKKISSGVGVAKSGGVQADSAAAPAAPAAGEGNGVADAVARLQAAHDDGMCVVVVVVAVVVMMTMMTTTPTTMMPMLTACARRSLLTLSRPQPPHHHGRVRRRDSRAQLKYRPALCPRNQHQTVRRSCRSSPAIL